MILLKNPLTLYIKFLLNWLLNYIKFNNFAQGYMAFINKTSIAQFVKFYDYVNVDNSEIGSFTYISINTRIVRTKIGKFCSIGPNCLIGWGLHPSNNFVSTHPVFYSLGKQSGITFTDKNHFEEHKEISIGNDVWIGANVVILDGVNIGDGSIIAAGAVVTKDVPNYAIFGGVPAKLIRYRFDNETISNLLNLKWWNQDTEWLKKNKELFLNVNEYCKFYKAPPDK